MTSQLRMKGLQTDIPPLEGRDDWTTGEGGSSPRTWAAGGFSVTGSLAALPGPGDMTMACRGRWAQASTGEVSGWAELELDRSERPLPADIFVVGSRPLPSAGVTCLCRHPARPDLLVAAGEDGRLLFLEADLPANLSLIAQAQLPVGEVVSLAVCGTRLAALRGGPGAALLVLELEPSGLGLKAVTRLELPAALVALAEGEPDHVWGLSPAGIIYKIGLPTAEEQLSPDAAPSTASLEIHCRLRRRWLVAAGIQQMALSIYRAFKNGDLALGRLLAGQGGLRAFAYDGHFFWVVRDRGRRRSSSMLMLYDGEGNLRRAFSAWPEASVHSLSYSHPGLWVIDREHLRCHRCHLVDTMEPVAGGPLRPDNHRLDPASFSPAAGSKAEYLPAADRAAAVGHPGYLPAGSPITAGIHDLCLLYVGGVGVQRLHRYDEDMLKPLVAYLSPQGEVRDIFMDGFLMLAQYSPLLNGRALGTDLRGRPSRQIDWKVLFDEYFHPRFNLQALERCAAEAACYLQKPAGFKLKVVLAVPTPDRRCRDWEPHGTSLAVPQTRIEAMAGAIRELLERWQKAGFSWLELAGFYYMDEQGSYDDPVLQAFPRLCRQEGLRSFAIPGLTSLGMTEFKRAGFDGVALQSSHAFRKPWGRPDGHWLKCAGQLAREFGMGLEVELPYNVQAESGQKVVRDYLRMARIQGWSGAFKAYFQSYDLISRLASSDEPGGRALYEELYHFSRLTRAEENPVQTGAGGSQSTFAWQEQAAVDGGERGFRLNVEGYPGQLEVSHLDVTHVPQYGRDR